MNKKGSIFFKFISLILFIAIFEAGAFSYSYFLLKFSSEPIIAALKTFFDYSAPSRELIFSQAILIGTIIFFIIFRKIMKAEKKKKRRKVDMQGVSRESGTSLDALYKILVERKSLNINFIADIFEIKRDLAMEWARILESGDLATLDYPGIGTPRLILKEKEETGEEKKRGEEKKKGSKEQIGKKKELPKNIIPQKKAESGEKNIEGNPQEKENAVEEKPDEEKEEGATKELKKDSEQTQEADDKDEAKQGKKKMKKSLKDKVGQK